MTPIPIEPGRTSPQTSEPRQRSPLVTPASPWTRHKLKFVGVRALKICELGEELFRKLWNIGSAAGCRPADGGVNDAIDPRAADCHLAGGGLRSPEVRYISGRQPTNRWSGHCCWSRAQMVRSVLSLSTAPRPTPRPSWVSLLIGGIQRAGVWCDRRRGGIFLAPLVLSLGWAMTLRTAAISVAFNLVNSAAALAGDWVTLPLLPDRLPIWLVCAGVAGFRPADGCAAPQPTSIAAAAGFPVACGVRMYDRCLFEASTPSLTAARYGGRYRRSGVTSAPRDRRPSRRAPSPHGLDVVICR